MRVTDLIAVPESSAQTARGKGQVILRLD